MQILQSFYKCSFFTHFFSMVTPGGWDTKSSSCSIFCESNTFILFLPFSLSLFLLESWPNAVPQCRRTGTSRRRSTSMRAMSLRAAVPRPLLSGKAASKVTINESKTFRQRAQNLALEKAPGFFCTGPFVRPQPPTRGPAQQLARSQTSRGDSQQLVSILQPFRPPDPNTALVLGVPQGTRVSQDLS